MTLSPRLVRLVGALLFLAPAVNLVWRGGTGYCFFLLVAISLYVAFANRHSREYFAPLRKYPWYTASMLVFMLAIALQQAVEHYWLPRQFDALSRFALALPLFLMLCRMSPRHLRAIGWGCVAGALAVAVWAIVARPPGGWTDATRLNNSYTNAIPFGDTALLLAFLSIFTFGWDPRRDWRTLAIKLLALVAGGFVSYLSGTRGGWLAVPIFVVLLGAQYGWFAHWKRLTVATAVVVACAVALLSTERMQHRLDEATTDVTLMQRGNDDTSVGLRLQLWQASLHIFSQHPLYGVGKGRLVDALGEMAKRGEVKSEIVNERAHSDFFSTLAEMGTVGVLCLALYYFGTLVYFWRHRRAVDPTIRAAAHAGLAVSFSTIIFGLTIDVLVPIMVTVLLALLTATLLAMIEVRSREIASVS